jgi:hypothetical protein
MSQGLLIQRQDYLDPNPLWRALGAHEACASVGGQVQDSFSFGARRALAFEPLAHASLHPENWKKLWARLDVSVRLTKKGLLALDISPWPEYCNLAARAANDRFEDFVEFQSDEDVPGRPTCTLFELPLDELKSELRGAGVNRDAAAISARRLVHLSYDHVLRNLARHFEVRVQTALLCLGDECNLLLRKIGGLENQVERPQRWAPAISWHGQYVPLCTQAGVAPDELLELYTATLQPLTESGRLSFLRQYLGKPPAPVVRRGRGRGSQAVPDPTRTLLRTLTVVASPDVFPPLMDHPSKSVEKHLLQLVTSTPLSGVATIAEQYCLDLPNVQNLVRQYYPEVLLATMVSASGIRAELEYTVAEHPDRVGLIGELQQRILLRLGQDWDEASCEAPATRKRKLGRAAGFSSFQAMMDWAQKYAPPLQAWLNSL